MTTSGSSESLTACKLTAIAQKKRRTKRRRKKGLCALLIAVRVCLRACSGRYDIWIAQFGMIGDPSSPMGGMQNKKIQDDPVTQVRRLNGSWSRTCSTVPTPEDPHLSTQT